MASSTSSTATRPSSAPGRNRVRFIDAYPPDAQGSVTYWLNGQIVYADGNTASIRVLVQQVCDKGDVLNREFLKTSCGGGSFTASAWYCRMPAMIAMAVPAGRLVDRASIPGLAQRS